MKKTYLASALIMLVCFSLVGCVSTHEQYDPDALSILGKKSDLNKPYMTEIFEHYKETTGENLNIRSVEDAEFEDEALRLLGTKDAPDILLHFHNADLNRFNVEENFLYFNDAAWADELTDSAKAYCTDASGNLLGLPFWESSVSGCYYNKTLLEEAGLRAASTQEGFNGLCRSLLHRDITPILWPANGCSWMAQFGLDPVFADEPDGPALLAQLNTNQKKYKDIPAVADMVTWLSDAAAEGWFGENYLKTGWNDISSALASGEAAMTFIWDTWFYTDFKPGKYSVDDFALMPIYMNTGATYEGGNLNMMMVNKNSEKRERALAFLDFCATPENYNVAFADIPTVPVFKRQITHLQSQMVTDATVTIGKYERVSTASTKIVGYSAEDMMNALNALFRGDLTVSGCIARMDENRIQKARASGAEGF